MRQESVNQIWHASQNGDPFAMTKMGILFYEGKYVKSSKQQGLSLLQQAAKNDVAWAQNIVLYITNVNPNDPLVSKHAIISSEAVHQLEEAGRNGNMFALSALGELYYYGYTTPQDRVSAIEYLNHSAKNGCLWAQDILQEISGLHNYNHGKENTTKYRAIDDSGRYYPKPVSPSVSEKEDPIAKLNSLIGLVRVKKEIESLRNFVVVQKQREKNGLKTTTVSYHCVFSGSPGTGKTTVARIVAEIYKDLGILKKGHLVEVQRADLVGEYVGQTAPKTNSKIDEALDGVLFIDEAYTLAQGDKNDFGAEAIATLLKRMEDDRNRLVVILAGYDNEIKQFIEVNPGLQSRFNRYIHFEDYNPLELMEIFLSYINKAQYKITREGHEAVFHILYKEVAKNDSKFGNARFVRNLFEKVIQKQADRLAHIPHATREQLSMITKTDVIDIM